MGPELATGLLTLGGVVVGAVASTGSQVYLESKWEARKGRRLSEDDLENDPVVTRARQIANDLADLKQDDGGEWLADINRRLQGVKSDRP